MSMKNPQLSPDGRTLGSSSQGSRIGKLCWAVLVSDRSLLALPVIAFAAYSLLVLSLIGIFILALRLGNTNPIAIIITILLSIGGYFGITFITTFTSAALIGSATLRLTHKPGTAFDGLRMAWAHVGKLSVWAFILTSGGVLFRWYPSTRSRFTEWLGERLLGIDWSVSLTFTIPILLFEGHGIRTSINRSARVIRGCWGDNLTSGVSVGSSLLLLVVFGFAVSIVLAVLSQPLPAIIAALLTIGAVTTCNTALNGIYRAVLFQCATQGTVATDLNFTDDDMAVAFQAPRDNFQ